MTVVTTEFQRDWDLVTVDSSGEGAGQPNIVFEYLAHLIIWQSPFPKDAGLQSFKKNKIRRNLQDKSDIFILKCIIFY